MNYIVQPGDSLSIIARDELNDANKWKEIAQLNNIPPPYTIYPGQVLQLPTFSDIVIDPTGQPIREFKTGLTIKAKPPQHDIDGGLIVTGIALLIGALLLFRK